MSQHQAGSAAAPVKHLKQTALAWKVKDKATSQVARSDARLEGGGVNHKGQGGTVLPKFRLQRVSAGSCFVRFHNYYNFEAVIVKFQFPLYRV